MRRSLATASFLVSGLLSVASAEKLQLEARSEFTSTCTEIEQAISSASSLHWPFLGLNAAYQKDIGHWALSSTTQAACSVEPGTAEDVGKILQIVGKNKTPFASYFHFLKLSDPVSPVRRL